MREEIELLKEVNGNYREEREKLQESYDLLLEQFQNYKKLKESTKEGRIYWVENLPIPKPSLEFEAIQNKMLQERIEELQKEVSKLQYSKGLGSKQEIKPTCFSSAKRDILKESELAEYKNKYFDLKL